MKNKVNNLKNKLKSLSDKLVIIALAIVPALMLTSCGYYGCPNSKNISKLNIERKRSGVII